MLFRKRRPVIGTPDAVPVSARAALKLREMKEKRPMSSAENACIAALAWQLGVPDGWLFDDKTMCFRPQQIQEKT